ncbi:MAG: hypothetical protein JO316_24660 [Abitibacteriaceae bacterium]|nr:hypothetical protein [Abditibacteriaceae bacterium]MBV9868559.1 hypothetical protein [Abditibacteriaceae bacterium]
MAEISQNTPVTDHLKDQAIAEYLDQLCAQLSTIPRERQADLRRELGAHLHQVLEGMDSASTLSEPVLLGRLVQEFGDPTTIGIQLARTHCPAKAATPAKSGLWLAFGLCVLTCCFSTYLDGALLKMESSEGGFGLLAAVLAGPAIPFVYGLLWGTRGADRRRDLRGLGGLVLSCLLATAPLPPAEGFLPAHWHCAVVLMWTLIALGAYGMVRAATAVQDLKQAIKP